MRWTVFAVVCALMCGLTLYAVVPRDNIFASMRCLVLGWLLVFPTALLAQWADS